MKIRKVILVLLVSATFMAVQVSSAFACGIEGTVKWSDGSKSDGSTKVSTSWNSKKAYPKNGRYKLELGSGACGKSMTVYLNGNQGKRITLPSSGNARVDFVAK